MIPKAITIELPVMPEGDALRIAQRVVVFGAYYRAIRADLKLPLLGVALAAVALTVAHQEGVQ